MPAAHQRDEDLLAACKMALNEMGRELRRICQKTRPRHCEPPVVMLWRARRKATSTRAGTPSCNICVCFVFAVDSGSKQILPNAWNESRSFGVAGFFAGRRRVPPNKREIVSERPGRTLSSGSNLQQILLRICAAIYNVQRYKKCHHAGVSSEVPKILQ